MPSPDRRLVAAVLLAAVAATFVTGVASGDPSTANGSEPFRILAGDDADPNRSVAKDTTWSVEDGTLRSRIRERGPPTYRLDGVPTHVTAIADLARATDGARSSLDRPVVVPVADDWRPVADAPVTDLRVIGTPRAPLSGSAGENRTADDRRVAVRHERHGHWLPVRNATLRYASNGYVIENPTKAMVDVGTYVNYTRRLREGQRALLGTASDPSRVSVPRAKGTPVTETSAGGSVPTRWAYPGGPAIRQHWASIMRASPGAFDGEGLLVGNRAIRLFVPGDFTGHVPSAWTQREPCGRDGGTRRRWERWSLLDAAQSAYTNGRRLPSVGPGVYRLRAPSTKTLTIEHRATIEVRHRWGVDDDCGRDRRGSRTVTINHTVRRSVPLRRVRSENLSVSVYVLERPNRRSEVHYYVDGHRGLTRGGLGSVTLSIGSANHTWHAPWAFYPVRTHDEVRVKRRNGTTVSGVDTAYRPDARYPNVYRDQVESEEHLVTANGLGFASTVESHGSSTSNRPFPARVRTGVEAESLYTHYGGTVSGVNGSLANASIDLTARNVLGEPVGTELHRRRFRPTSFDHRIHDSIVSFRLTSDGVGLEGRAVAVRGARRNELTTNETGWVRVRPTGTVVGVSVAESDYRADRTAYYEAERTSVAVPGALQRPEWVVTDALFGAVAGATSVSGWLAIGWCLRWQRQRRPDR
jgi:hypothetical protein